MSSAQHHRIGRRVFLARSASATAATLAYAKGLPAESADKNDRPAVAVIGAGWQPEVRRFGRGMKIGQQAAEFADVAVVCEVDTVAGDRAVQDLSGGKADLVDDYRRVIDRDDIDAVLIGTPDHWHVKIAVEALRAGKDVYCEKPVTVTIDEGKILRDVVKETGRVFQVGTQQRSEYDSRFLKAVALVRNGRVGKLSQIHIGLGPGRQGKSFQKTPVPTTLNWERWLGPAPKTAYIPERCHRMFRFWYEYAGGQMTDWGAHHVDIAQWAIGRQNDGPVSVAGTGTMNQPLDRNGMPTRSDTYNTPVDFSVKCVFPGDVEMVIDSSRNGITFTGDAGRFFVNRGKLEGKPVDQLESRPLPEDAVAELYGGKEPTSHMGHFFDCLKTRGTPISDIDSHHRILTTCHLANISLRLGRPIRWDSRSEQIIGDEVATSLMSRSYREGYEF